MSKKHCSVLPHDVVECILERLPVISLLRFRAVSKQWKSTVDSRFFQERQLRQRQKSGDPDVLLVSVRRNDDVFNQEIDSLRTLALGSSSSVQIPTPWENACYFVDNANCDGLVCLYDPHKPGFVVNPTTRWYRPLPLCDLQKLIIDLGDEYYNLMHPLFVLGFGKDKFTGTYKPVWLYNSKEIGLENATTCQVFDFSINAWRYITPAAPYRILGCSDPVYLDGSLHWFTDCNQTKVVSLDLHTEAFQVLAKPPFANSDRYKIVMCNLDNRLCVSEMKLPNQVIWSFNSGNKTWDKICSIDLNVTSFWFGSHICALSPLAFFHVEKKKKLLFFNGEHSETLVIHDPETQSYDDAFSAQSIGYPVCYYQSLFSILLTFYLSLFSLHLCFFKISSRVTRFASS